MSACIVHEFRVVNNLLCHFRNVDPARTQKCNTDSEVVHDLLEDEEPDGVS
jgi:hypothetical protein